MSGTMKILAAGMLLMSLPTLAQQEARVVVMTSYPQEMISRYESAFETYYPGIDMVIEWRRSDDARQLLESGNAAVDVYWAPSLDTFVALANENHFSTLPLPYHGVPRRIGDLQIDDAQQRFAAFEVAGFGFAYSKEYLDAHQLSVPQDWTDLADAEYAGSLLLPVPSRHGFSPMIYASMLQGYGWEQGWSLISAIAANGVLMGGGGGSFVDELADAHQGVALSIDFFPRSAEANGQPVAFRYAATTLLSPAYVAQLKAAPNPEAAQTFIKFALSEAGQKRLLHRDVSRLPVLPSAYDDGADFNPFADGVKVPAFDFSRAGSQQILLAALFDVQVSNRHAALVTALTRLREAEQRAGSNQRTKAKLAYIRTLLAGPVIGAEAAARLLGKLDSGEIIPAALPVQAWTDTLNSRMEQAEWLMRDVPAALP